MQSENLSISEPVIFSLSKEYGNYFLANFPCLAFAVSYHLLTNAPKNLAFIALKPINCFKDI